MIIIYPIITIAIIVIDQLVKIAIQNNLYLEEQISIIGDFFTLSYYKNNGAAFNLFNDNPWFTQVFTSILLIACLVFLIKEIKDNVKFLAIALTFIFAGGLSNLLDRIRFGYVVDMFYIKGFAVINIADIFVCLGCILAIIYIFFIDKETQGSKNE